MSAALELDRLSVALRRSGRDMSVLDELSLTIAPGEMQALVGESGSGKSIAALSILGLLPRGAKVTGSIRLAGKELVGLSENGLRDMRGRDVGMIFQNPLSALNPSRTIGAQIAEAYTVHHRSAPKAEVAARVHELMTRVRLEPAAERARQYPHEFSGGMRQRAMIAMALANGPKLLIADEPTTGLDPVVAGEVMDLIGELKRAGMAILFVTHDLSVVERHADRIHVLYAGKSAEWGPARTVLAAPRHPYTEALLNSVPRLGAERLRGIQGNLPEPEQRPSGCRFRTRCRLAYEDCAKVPPATTFQDDTALCWLPLDDAARATIQAEEVVAAHPPLAKGQLLTLDHVAVRYERPFGSFAKRAERDQLAEISFSVGRGECMGVVGSSGSGKSTLGRAILQMVQYRGDITLDGLSFTGLRGEARSAARRRIQVVFQDPKESLNPRLTVGQSIGEALRLGGLRDWGAIRERTAELLGSVSLPAAIAEAIPSGISGGQAQRVAIARALAADPEVIVLDEPTASLDVSTQATLLNLLKDLGRAKGLSYILISHDLAVVSYLADRIMVLQDGRAVEFGTSQSVLHSPSTDYTRRLVGAAAHVPAAV